MNNDQINSIIRSALKIGGTILAADGYQTAGSILCTSGLSGACLAAFGMILSYLHHTGLADANSTPQPPAKPPGAALLLFFVVSCSLLFTGCMTEKTYTKTTTTGTGTNAVTSSVTKTSRDPLKEKWVYVKQTLFGLFYQPAGGAASSATGNPAGTLGIGLERTVVITSPTSTNGPVHAAKFASHVNASSSLISQTAQEDLTSDEAQSVTTGTNGVENVTAQ